jgi:hypothetical protein
MKMEIYTTCPFCGKDHFITVSFEDYEKWQAGELIQNAFPYLSADEREMLKTGICPSCWDKMFPPEEEDDEPEEFDYDFADTYCEIGFNPYIGCYDWDE